MRNSEYWQERFNQIEQAANNKSVRYARNLEKKYKVAASELDAQINKWYNRIAKNNNVSMSEARRLLSASELKEFKWTVEEYIKHGRKNALDQQWIKELENASAKFHINRLEAMKLECRHQIEKAMANGQEDMFDVLSDVYRDTFYHGCYEIQKGVGVGFDVSKLDDTTVSRLLNKPWSPDGTNFSKKLWGNKTKLINQLDQELTRMILTGEAPNKAIRNIKEAMNSSLHNAKRLVLTEQAYFTSEAQKKCFNDLDVERFEVLSGMDERVCPICAEKDKTVHLMTEFYVGVTAPPFHPLCRCVTSPYFDDEFTVGATRVAKGEDGETYRIPQNMSYNEWKATFVDGESKERLVPNRLTNEKHEIRTHKQILEAANSINADLDNIVSRKSLWNGKVKVVKSDTISAAPYDGSIEIAEDASDITILHELLHTRSYAKYGKSGYISYYQIEEASVELLARQIALKENFPIVTKREDVEALLKINQYVKIKESDYGFAIELFNAELPDRTTWLMGKIGSSDISDDAKDELWDLISHFGF